MDRHWTKQLTSARYGLPSLHDTLQHQSFTRPSKNWTTPSLKHLLQVRGPNLEGAEKKEKKQAGNMREPTAAGWSQVKVSPVTTHGPSHTMKTRGCDGGSEGRTTGPDTRSIRIKCTTSTNAGSNGAYPKTVGRGCK